jgi:uncharacterized protein (TIGR02996 family)
VAERDAFLAALAANEDDVTTRLVYADWLDEHGEHEEADRQRKWPAAKEWLVAFAKRFNHDDPPDMEHTDRAPNNYRELIEIGYFPVIYRTLIEIGHLGLANGYVDCGNNDSLCDALREDDREFWKYWSIVTGVPVPDETAGGWRTRVPAEHPPVCERGGRMFRYDSPPRC